MKPDIVSRDWSRVPPGFYSTCSYCSPLNTQSISGHLWSVLVFSYITSRSTITSIINARIAGENESSVRAAAGAPVPTIRIAPIWYNTCIPILYAYSIEPVLSRIPHTHNCRPVACAPRTESQSDLILCVHQTHGFATSTRGPLMHFYRGLADSTFWSSHRTTDTDGLSIVFISIGPTTSTLDLLESRASVFQRSNNKLELFHLTTEKSAAASAWPQRVRSRRAWRRAGARH